jgi:hypothetical protein
MGAPELTRFLSWLAVDGRVAASTQNQALSALLSLYGDVRRRLLRFPYALLYKSKPSGIRILAVMNLRRRPAYWIGRE